MLVDRTIVESLSDYAAALRFDDLPPEVVHQAKRLLIDTLGCAIGGFAGEPSVVARALAESVVSRQPATVLGSGQETSPDLATFANGVMIRYLDFNELVQRVNVSVSEEANRRAPEAMLSIVEVVTSGGARFRAAVPYHRGHWKNPMTDDEVEAKFRTLAHDRLAPPETDALLKRLWNLDQVKDIGEVIKMVKWS